MNIKLSVRECVEVGHIHYRLASGFYTGAAEISNAEKRELLENARIWFDRAYIYGACDSNRRMAEICAERQREIRPGLFAVGS